MSYSQDAPLEEGVPCGWVLHTDVIILDRGSCSLNLQVRLLQMLSWEGIDAPRASRLKRNASGWPQNTVPMQLSEMPRGL
eukprot:scaffold141068_cov17-Tisochrysis_lutea.AAC.3